MVMETLLRYRGYAILTLIYAIVFGGYVLYERRPQPEPIEIVEPTMVPTSTPSPIHVHVTGAVQRPGLYVLSPASRLAQALEAAGGMTSDADQERVNLADRVLDGQQVYVPTRGTPPPPSPTPCASAHSQAVLSSGDVLSRININKASLAELDTLPGIGPAYAQRIVAYREANGPFADPSEIVKVKGIGQVTYDRIKELITVD